MEKCDRCQGKGRIPDYGFGCSDELCTDCRGTGKKSSIKTNAIQTPKLATTDRKLRISAATGPVIDCSVEPFIPPCHSIRPEDQMASRFTGDFVWSPENIRLHLTDLQQVGGYIEGNDFKKILGVHCALPANVLDWLILNPSEVPDDWKRDLAVGFWGTIFRDIDRSPCVRYLCCGGRFDGRVGHYWLDDEWSSKQPAAVLIS